jgi:hypothetical protein
VRESAWVRGTHIACLPANQVPYKCYYMVQLAKMEEACW